MTISPYLPGSIDPILSAIPTAAAPLRVRAVMVSSTVIFIYMQAREMVRGIEPEKQASRIQVCCKSDGGSGIDKFAGWSKRLAQGKSRQGQKGSHNAFFGHVADTHVADMEEMVGRYGTHLRCKFGSAESHNLICMQFKA